MAKRYFNKRNKRYAIFDSFDEKTRTTILVYEDDGKSISQSNPTMKRWWTLVSEDYEPEVPQEEPEPEVEEPVKKEPEIVHQSAKRKQSKADPRPKYFDLFLQKAEAAGIETKTYPKIKYLVLLKQDKKRMEVRFQRNEYLVYAKEEMIPNEQDFRVINNYYLPAEVREHYVPSTSQRLDSIIKWFLNS